MGERELREKYGGKLPKAINRAIRAEIPGGNEALDRLTHLAAPVLQSGWKDDKGRDTPEALAYFKHKRDVVDRLNAQVCKKWGVPIPTLAPARKPERKNVAGKRKPPKTPRSKQKR